MTATGSAPEWEKSPSTPETPIDVPFPETGFDWQAVWSVPQIEPSVWVAPGAIVNGRVRLHAQSTIWYGCVLRGDGEYIEVGEGTNVQDGSILHVDPGYPCVLGKRVTLGHRAIVHASVVHDGALIGMAATVLSRCVIGEGALIAGGSLVREGTEVPPNTLWAGCPARKIADLSDAQQAKIAHIWKHYVNGGAVYLARYGREHIDALLR